jgi:periplasmic protein TonB
MASAEIFFEHEHWGRNLSWSLGLHIGIAAAIVLYAVIAPGHGSNWGDNGGGEAMGVSIVNTVPLPANPVKTQSVLATESKGLSESQPKPKQEDLDAIPIADKHAKVKPKPQASETLRKPQPQPQQQADNIVPYGEGGPSTTLYGSFNAGPVNAGFNFTGGGGDFGTRFAWYVRVISQKVHENWLAYEVDPSIHEANRFYLTFDITRDGHPTNIHVEQSSGIPSLDLSAVRALQRIDTFGPLPSDYSGNKVSVEFSFDYKK